MAPESISGILGGIRDSVSNAVSFNNTLVGDFSPELASMMSGLITILKAAGIIIIAYIIFLLIKSLLGMRRNMRIDATYHKVNQIEEKINILIEQNKEYRKLFEKKEAEGKFKKKGLIRRFISKLGEKKGSESKTVPKGGEISLPEIKKPEKEVEKKREKKK